MRNDEIASALHELADLLDAKGAEPFKARAYRRAAEAVARADQDLSEAARQGRLTAIAGVGKGIAARIEELVQTGRIRDLEELRKAVPPGLHELARVPGLGRATARLLYERLGIDSLDRLELAARKGELRTTPRIGERREAAILASLEAIRRVGDRVQMGFLLPLAEALLAAIRRHPAVLAADLAGSIRRRVEVVEDIDVVVATVQPGDVIKFCRGLPIAGEIVQETADGIVMQSSLGRRIDLFCVPPRQYGSALVQMTGSPAHLSALGPLPAAPTEEEIYRSKGLPVIPPELREGRGEVEAARAGALPHLLERSDLKGDLHTHTTASDGTEPLGSMVAAAKALGHQYLGVCDHSQSLHIARGLTPQRLAAQRTEIEAARQAEPDLLILHGSEVDILRNGKLDFADAVLEELDLVVASIHSHMRLDEPTQTERLLAAIKNPHVDIIGHPTGRVLTRREAYPLEMERIFEACARTGTALEISASPARLDLSDIHARLAKMRGVKLVIDTDAHSVEELGYLHHGVAQARRGWVERDDVINALSSNALLAWLSHAKG